MPESWVDQIYSQLRQSKAELEKRLLRVHQNHRRSLDSDSKERATELENQEVVDALGNEARIEINQISAALARIDAGEFGICTGCGATISRQRLAACPHADKCIDCATQDERH